MWLRLFRPLILEGIRAKIVFETATLSAAGGRIENQDSCGFRTVNGKGCWVLADGLGGHRGGQIASHLAVEAALASFDRDPMISREALDTHIERANRAVLDGQSMEPELEGMRTTIVILLASADAAFWAHAGDSRLYWFRDGNLRERTRDDSVPQRLADAGEISEDRIRFHEDRSRLLNSLGGRADVSVSHERTTEALRAGDHFLLASDGFWEWVEETEMEEDLRVVMNREKTNQESWLARMESRIRERADASHDNYSAIAVSVYKEKMV